ncbi:D-alanyl-D-alanine carboxypeptidase [Paenibacillus sp. J2TS4]|nr:D-alanyl-D-alanine carboxypeptidase [Paenibacillus sp. J2TS4]
MLLAALVCIATILSGVPEQAYADENFLNLEVKSAILMDAATGQVIFEFNADEHLPPASMAKMMTEYIVMEKISNGELSWDEIVTTTEYASKVIGSGQLLAYQEKLPVKDMFASMSIYSGNDASVALAEHIAGNEEAFANMMNEKARELGLSEKAHFINSTGLGRDDIGTFAPKNIPGETMMSARDAALLAYNIIKDHKEILEYSKTTRRKLRERDTTEMTNWNWMLEGWSKDSVSLSKYAYEGLDGLKTGHTNEAGYCFTGTAERDGMRLISVVMGAESEPKRFEETRKLLDYGFNNFEKKTVYESGSAVEELQDVKMKKGVKTKVPVVTGSDLTILVKKGTKDEEIVKEATPLSEKDLVAPIKQGDKMGTLKVQYDNQEFSVDLVAAQDNDKGSWLRLFFRAIKDFFVNLGISIKNLF